MDKAERIYKELMHEPAAIWYISDEYGSKVMVKAPTTSIKALSKGCKIELLFGRDESHDPNIFHTGIKIHDDAINYQIIFCTHRFLDEHLSIAKILHLDKVQIQFFNELNVCQAFGDLILKEADKHQVLALLGNPKKLYTGDFSKEIDESLDRFQDRFMIPSPVISPSILPIEIDGQIINFKSIKNYFYQEGQEVLDIHIAGNEGEELEKEVFAAMYSLFHKDTIKNPRVPNKTTTRELTDILAFSELGIFLIETKALSVLNTEADRTMDRKVVGLQKQINKAINQLTGAMKKLVEKTPIYDSTGSEVIFNRTLVPHGIILVSEFLQFGEWDKIILSMFEAMIESKSMIHVLDMKEFMRFIGYAKGDKHIFDDFLCQRAKHFVQHRTLFQDSKFINKRIGKES